MSSKTQQEYITHFKDTFYEYGTNSKTKAYKLLYQWVKTGLIKQSTVLELMSFVEGE